MTETFIGDSPYGKWRMLVQSRDQTNLLYGVLSDKACFVNHVPAH